LFAALSGMSITYFGYFQPYLGLGSAFFTVGAGLIYTLDIGSSAAKYLGYQIILGVGQGIAIQIPVITGQAFSEPADIPAVTAMVLCKFFRYSLNINRYRQAADSKKVFQMMGGTVFVSGAQSVFANRLLSTLVTNAPEVDASQVLAVGATELQDYFPTAELAGIQKSYMTGLKGAFAFGIAVAGVAFLASCTAPIRSIKRKAIADSGSGS
jgi:MFS transporter, DHA2 family, glioxin efflux transporter